MKQILKLLFLMGATLLSFMPCFAKYRQRELIYPVKRESAGKSFGMGLLGGVVGGTVTSLASRPKSPDRVVVQERVSYDSSSTRALERQLKDLEGENDELRRELKEMKRKVSRVQEEREEVAQETTKLQADLKTALDSNKNVEKRLDELLLTIKEKEDAQREKTEKKEAARAQKEKLKQCKLTQEKEAKAAEAKAATTVPELSVRQADLYEGMDEEELA